jgi:hypothetical protein
MVIITLHINKKCYTENVIQILDTGLQESLHNKRIRLGIVGYCPQIKLVRIGKKPLVVCNGGFQPLCIGGSDTHFINYRHLLLLLLCS